MDGGDAADYTADQQQQAKQEMESASAAAATESSPAAAGTWLQEGRSTRWRQAAITESSDPPSSMR